MTVPPETVIPRLRFRAGPVLGTSDPAGAVAPHSARGTVRGAAVAVNGGSPPGPSEWFTE